MLALFLEKIESLVAMMVFYCINEDFANLTGIETGTRSRYVLVSIGFRSRGELSGKTHLLAVQVNAIEIIAEVSCGYQYQ